VVNAVLYGLGLSIYRLSNPDDVITWDSCRKCALAVAIDAAAAAVAIGGNAVAVVVL
jgi:hypothetical protein